MTLVGKLSSEPNPLVVPLAPPFPSIGMGPVGTTTRTVETAEKVNGATALDTSSYFGDLNWRTVARSIGKGGANNGMLSGDRHFVDSGSGHVEAVSFSTMTQLDT